MDLHGNACGIRGFACMEMHAEFMDLDDSAQEIHGFAWERTRDAGICMGKCIRMGMHGQSMDLYENAHGSPVYFHANPWIPCAFPCESITLPCISMAIHEFPLHPHGNP